MLSKWDRTGTVLLILVSGVASAGPLDDVPKGHWAYESFSGLQRAGLTSQQDMDWASSGHLATRYEMTVLAARLVYRANLLRKRNLLTEEQRKLLPELAKLITEFAPELQAMKLKIADLMGELRAAESIPSAAQQLSQSSGSQSSLGPSRAPGAKEAELPAKEEVGSEPPSQPTTVAVAGQERGPDEPLTERYARGDIGFYDTVQAALFPGSFVRELGNGLKNGGLSLALSGEEESFGPLEATTFLAGSSSPLGLRDSFSLGSDLSLRLSKRFSLSAGAAYTQREWTEGVSMDAGLEYSFSSLSLGAAYRRVPSSLLMSPVALQPTSGEGTLLHGLTGHVAWRPDDRFSLSGQATRYSEAFADDYTGWEYVGTLGYAGIDERLKLNLTLGYRSETTSSRATYAWLDVGYDLSSAASVRLEYRMARESQSTMPSLTAGDNVIATRFSLQF